MNDYQIRILKLSKEDGDGYIAFVPELKGCMSDGDTPEKALRNVQGAIFDWILAANARKQAIPKPILFNLKDLDNL
jgi:predicted RNase H-like HicB family nuclease